MVPPHRSGLPLLLPTSIFSKHPKLSLDLRDTPRDAVKASFFVRITLLNLSQCKHALNMFQNFAPLVFNHVADHRGEIIYAKVGEADPFCSPVKSHAIILNLLRANGSILRFTRRTCSAMFISEIMAQSRSHIANALGTALRADQSRQPLNGLADCFAVLKILLPSARPQP